MRNANPPRKGPTNASGMPPRDLILVATVVAVLWVARWLLGRGGVL